MWPFTYRKHAPNEAPEAKASATGPLIAFSGVGQPTWTPRDYEALAREGYAANAIAYRCVRLISESTALIPWVAHRNGQLLDTHPLLSLLDRPNPMTNGRDLMSCLVGHLQVAGNAYLEAVYVERDGERRPVELHCLRPDRMRVVPGADGWPEAYEYRVSGRTHRFNGGPGGEILHLSLFNPINDYYGLSPLEAAARSVDVHNATGGWLKALLENAARPSGALIYEGSTGAPNLSHDQFERLKAELQDHYVGAANAGRPMLLEGGLDWKPMGFSPSDMEFISARHSAARDIALAFGVPPMLLGIPGDNTYSNYQEANRAFTRQTVLPLMDKVVSALDNWLCAGPGKNIKLSYDLNKLPALLPEREALWKRMSNARFLTTNEKRNALGFEPLEGGDRIGET